jgi:putative addiction module killer protein
MKVEKTEQYRRWIDGLKDRDGRARILVRVDRMIHGNAGDFRNLTNGVSELRIKFGPGYRVYFSKRGNHFILLLAGGDKATQQRDIALAISLATNYEPNEDEP